MSVEYEYPEKDLTGTMPALNNIHTVAAGDEQIAGHCGISETFHLNFEEALDGNGVPQGYGTLTAVWSGSLCVDCKGAFDIIIADNS